MNYLEFSNNIRDNFDNVLAIHWKESSLFHVEMLCSYLKNNEFSVHFYTSEIISNENIDFQYIERFFDGKENDYPSLEIKIVGFKFNCFLEDESSISLWFNDSENTEITTERFNLIKNLMTDIAFTFNRSVYFVNEGDSMYRYKIF